MSTTPNPGVDVLVLGLLIVLEFGALLIWPYSRIRHRERRVLNRALLIIWLVQVAGCVGTFLLIQECRDRGGADCFMLAGLFQVLGLASWVACGLTLLLTIPKRRGAR